MIKKFAFSLAAASMALTAAPAIAQDDGDYVEEERTTYSVTLIKLADGAENRWLEMHDQYVVAAHKALGRTPPTVHFIMLESDYNLMIVNEMPDGMSAFDSHQPAGRTAFRQKVAEIAGGQENMPAILEEWNGLEEKSKTFYTHTHP